MFFAGMIKEDLGYMYNYALGILTSVLAMAYTLVIVKDSRKVREARLAKEATEALLQNDKNNALEPLNPEGKIPLPIEESSSTEEKTNCQKYLSVFDLKNVLESWQACLKPRPYYKRTLIWLCIGIFCVEIFVIMDKWSNSYLFFRRTLKWDIKEYSTYITTY